MRYTVAGLSAILLLGPSFLAARRATGALRVRPRRDHHPGSWKVPKGLASDVREDLAAAIYRDFRAALAAQFDAEGDLAMP